MPIPTFGVEGVVDLKQDNDQELDLVTADLGLNATPLVAGDVVVVGAAQRFSGSPRTMKNARGYVRGFDVRTGKRLWIFHTIPRPGEFGFDTWDDDSASAERQHRRVGAVQRRPRARAGLRAGRDADRGLLRRQPARQHPVRREPGRAGHQDRQAQVALPDHPSRHLGLRPAVRADSVRHDVSGRRVKALALPTKQAFLFVLNRETGEPIWPIEERPVPQSTVPREKTSPTQPFPTRPRHSIGRASAIDDLIDFTPALRAEALEVIKRYRIGPMYTPPVLERLRRSARDAAGAGRPRRRELAGRRDRSRDQPPLHPLSHRRLRGRHRPRRSCRLRYRLRGRNCRAGGPPAQRRRGADAEATRRAAAAPADGRGGGRGALPDGAAAAARGHDRAGAAADQAALRSDHRLRHEHRRADLAEAPQLDA